VTILKSIVICLALANVGYFLWARGIAKPPEAPALGLPAATLKLASESSETPRAAGPDAGNAAAANRTGIHRHRLADGAALADLQPGRFTAIAERLRRRTKRGERIDRAAGADAGVPHDMDMGDQLAVRADNDVAANHAEGADRRALADHSTVFNPCGWVDRSHRGAALCCKDFA